jgi:hypothetical protein
MRPPGEALLTALAGMAALRQGLHAEVLEMGAEPCAFAGAVALAARLAEEVRRLGGDPDALLTRAYCAASEKAP